VSAPNARQRRILSGILRGDPVFEVPQQTWFTQFNENSGRQIRITLDELEAMRDRGWVVRVSAGAQRCDHWEITQEGREAVSADQ
jgi:hypothetical protein